MTFPIITHTSRAHTHTYVTCASWRNNYSARAGDTWTSKSSKPLIIIRTYTYYNTALWCGKNEPPHPIINPRHRARDYIIAHRGARQLEGASARVITLSTLFANSFAMTDAHSPGKSLLNNNSPRPRDETRANSSEQKLGKASIGCFSYREYADVYGQR